MFGTDKEGRFANLLLALFVKEDVDLSIYKLCDEILEIHIVTPIFGEGLKSTKLLEIEVDRLVRNVKYISSYIGEKTSLAPLVNLVDMRNQSTHFTKYFLESILLSKPLSNTVLSEILQQDNKSNLVADLLRYHINKTKEFGQIGIYLDNNIQTVSYLSGRLFATLEQIVKLSDNREPLTISYSRFANLRYYSCQKFQPS